MVGGGGGAASWVSLELDYADAKALQRDLFELNARCSGSRGAQIYHMGLTLVPTRARSGRRS